MRKSAMAVFVSCMALVSSCEGGYAGSNYAPVIDTQASVQVQGKARDYNADLGYCQSLAGQRSVLTAGSQGAGVGGIVGAGGGALAGILYGGGNVAEGALIGAAMGALTSGTYSAIEGNRGKQDITINCMRSRGWSVLAR